MNVTIDHVAFITRNSNFLFNASFFLLLIGFLYGYAISFVFGVKKTAAIGFFFVIIISTIIMFVVSGYLMTKNCTELVQGGDCSNAFAVVSSLSTWVFYILAHLFINLGVGYAGVGLGIGLRYPSEWIMKKFFNISFQAGDLVPDLQGKVYQTFDRAPSRQNKNVLPFFNPPSAPGNTTSASQQNGPATNPPTTYKPKQDFQLRKENWGSIKKPV